MTKFYVGQRVRFVRPSTETGKRNVGRTAVVDAINVLCSNGRRTEYGLRYDGDGHISGVDGWQIEPILYDGNQTVSWEECGWIPPEMRESVG